MLRLLLINCHFIGKILVKHDYCDSLFGKILVSHLSARSGFQMDDPDGLAGFAYNASKPLRRGIFDILFRNRTLESKI